MSPHPDQAIPRARRWPRSRFLLWTFAAFLVFGVAPGTTPVRHAMSWPLIVHDEAAAGDAVYVMQGGLASEERLRAAADLYQMGRVPAIYVLQDDNRSYYSFAEKRSFTRTEWVLSYLGWLGIPRDKIHVVADDPTQYFGTLHEAELVKATLPADVHRLVVVTSPVHTRRSGFTFRRRLADRGISVTTYGAIDWSMSAEAFAPLWLEYLKVAVYAVMA
ncbi:MAG: YdcF family protein [Vicinamibacterales bacterium]